MLRDLALAAKAACDQKDQESIVPVIRMLTDMGDKAKKRGLLALEEEQSRMEDLFLRMGLQLVLDQNQPETVRDILDSDIYYNESNGRELLKKIIIREGVLRIQAGDTARNILLCTRIFLGKVDVATFERLYG